MRLAEAVSSLLRISQLLLRPAVNRSDVSDFVMRSLYTNNVRRARTHGVHRYGLTCKYGSPQPCLHYVVPLELSINVRARVCSYHRG